MFAPPPGHSVSTSIPRTVLHLALAVAASGCTAPGPRPAVLDNGATEVGASPVGGGVGPSNGTEAGAGGVDAGPASGEDGSTDGAPDASQGSSEARAPDGDAGTDAMTSGGDGATSASTTVCNPAASWGAGSVLPISTGNDALGQITPDELTIAWTLPQGSTMTIAYADRTSPGEPFGPVQMIHASQVAPDRIALSPDGLRIVVVAAGRQGFAEITRPSRTGSSNGFHLPGIGGYAHFAADGALGPGESFGDPVLGADDTAFYYSVYGGPSTATIHRSVRSAAGVDWPLGAPLPSCAELAAQPPLRRRPTGISSDGATLFVWDQVTSRERAVWLDPGGSVVRDSDLGPRSMAAPNAACSRLYYSATAGAGSDLFVASQ